ncbi:hypothetical protein BCR44DRAFT_56988 [Catenaria anguillulae PL171]|uniref:Acetyl-CoA synthetase-like protein n=1 Tax=Catenaria anguillulae PL171 TaxID=765915 RepID=A0A1Y2HB01_9FUNG|nr:hypothetical protein BCR44DRAFT_56988 [Catenaria anguillulae PL171]
MLASTTIEPTAQATKQMPPKSATTSPNGSGTDHQLHPAIFAPTKVLDTTDYTSTGPNLASFLLSRIRTHSQTKGPDQQIAFTRALHPADTLTYTDFLQGVPRLARKWMTQSNVQRGDRIVLFAPNHVRWPAALFGGWLAGASMTLINPVLTREETAEQVALAEGQVKAIVTVSSMVDEVMDILTMAKLDVPVFTLDEHVASDEKHGEIKSIGDMMSDATQDEELAGVEFPQVQGSDVACICFSSGTTGKNKAAALTHANIASNLLQVAQHEYLSVYQPTDVFDAVLPYYHVYGLVVLCLMSMYLGCTTVLMPEPRFDLVAWLKLVQEYKVTISHLVPPIMVGLAKHPIVDKFDLSSLRRVTVGAAPLDAEVQATVAKRLGAIIRQGYGCTECSPVTHLTTTASLERNSDPSDPATALGTIGSLVPSMYAVLATISPDTDPACPASLVPITSPNTPGELLVSGPNVMPGYIDNDQANSVTFLEWQGRRWLRTGDVAVLKEDGQTWMIVDRIKELIKYKGYQVAPAELEGLLLTHAAVMDAAVVGKPDRDAGEVPVGFVVLKPGVEDGDEIRTEIRAFVDAKVAPYRKLRGGVRVVDAIPKSATGKILRRVLKAKVNAESD